jgi:CRP-like cAMP-binding protein
MNDFFSFLNGDLVISGMLAFIGGMIAMMVYTKIRSNIDGKYGSTTHSTDDAIVEAIVQEYTRQLRDYDKIIADLRVKLDIMEARSQSQFIVSQQQRQSHLLLTSQSQEQQRQSHAAATSNKVAITQLQQPDTTIVLNDNTTTTTTFDDKQNNNNGTTDYILKLLLDKPLTSREIQHAIGRTREHTSRLMKKLHDHGLVSRDINSKPFKYAITDSGRKRLQEKVEGMVPSELPSAV